MTLRCMRMQVSLDDEVKQSFIADQRIVQAVDWKEVSANSSWKKKIRWIKHTWILPRATIRASLSLSSLVLRARARAGKRSVSRGAHFYLFHPVTRVAHSNPYAPTRHPWTSCTAHCRISPKSSCVTISPLESQEIPSHLRGMRFSMDRSDRQWVIRRLAHSPQMNGNLSDSWRNAYHLRKEIILIARDFLSAESRSIDVGQITN